MTLTTITAITSPDFSNLLAFYYWWIKTFWVTYNCNFNNKIYWGDTIVNKKAYNTNQIVRVEVWMEDIIKWANI